MISTKTDQKFLIKIVHSSFVASTMSVAIIKYFNAIPWHLSIKMNEIWHFHHLLFVNMCWYGGKVFFLKKNVTNLPYFTSGNFPYQRPFFRRFIRIYYAQISSGLKCKKDHFSQVIIKMSRFVYGKWNLKWADQTTENHLIRFIDLPQQSYSFPMLRKCFLYLHFHKCQLLWCLCVTWNYFTWKNSVKWTWTYGEKE